MAKLDVFNAIARQLFVVFVIFLALTMYQYESEDEHSNYEIKVDDKHRFNSELPWGTQRIKIPFRDLVFFAIIHGNSTKQAHSFPNLKDLIGVQTQSDPS